MGSTFRNRGLAETYDLLGGRGTGKFYTGALAREIVAAVRKPPRTSTTTLPVPVGTMSRADLRDYRLVARKPTRVGYRGYDVYGMAPSSSGGSTVGEALNNLERFDLGALPVADALHRYLEASALAFADRGAYVGDPDYADVPHRALLDDRYAAERACSINPTVAAEKPVAAAPVTG